MPAPSCVCFVTTAVERGNQRTDDGTHITRDKLFCLSLSLKMRRKDFETSKSVQQPQTHDVESKPSKEREPEAILVALVLPREKATKAILYDRVAW